MLSNFCLNNQSSICSSNSVFRSTPSSYKNMQHPSRELTYDKLFTTLISVHRMTDSKRCVPVHLYYIQLSRTITGKDLISWKDVHTVPEKFR